MSIEIRNVTKSFGKFTVLNDVSLEVATGELVALLGPSGCGKTSLLRIIAGMESPDAGSIKFHGQDTTRQHARDRHVGFVFQHYALFRHMTIFENVAFGLRVKPRKVRPSEAQIQQRVHELLNLVQLDWLADRYPAQLSGGQRQRVALARALAVEPKVLLLDEPFGALDTKVRKELRRWLRRLHNDMHITTVFVTHDQEEALEVADKVVVLNRGRIEQVGTPTEVYDKPASPFVYQFLGNVNLFRGRVNNGWAHIGELQLQAPEHATQALADAIAYVRMHDIEFDRQASTPDCLAANIVDIRMVGAVMRLELSIIESSEIVEAEISRERFQSENYALGETIYVRLKNVKVFVEPDSEVPST